tara:strand:+ start:395 stop:622 length:228 start_codon:yes stop_codon:yes gene_type:complete
VKKWRKSAVFSNWHASCNVVGVRRDRPPESKKEIDFMTTTDLGSRLFAAVFALGVSAVFFATAIVPASPNGLVIA